MNKRYGVAVAILGSALVSAVCFQNCSKVAVQDMKDEKSLVAATGQPDPTSDSETPISATTTTTVPVVLSSTTTTTLLSQPPMYQPMVGIKANPTDVIEGQNSVLTFSYKDVDQVSYMCTDRVTKEILAAGAVSSSGQQMQIKVERDIHCEVMGNPLDKSAQIRASQDLTVNCGNRIKNMAQNKCQDFSCTKVTELTSVNDLMNIPARDSNGVCYAYKLLSKIANSSSSLTKDIDTEVLSRNHDSTGPRIHNPYNMGSVKAEFQLQGPRVVKVAGGLSPSAPILVDNFILMGVYPSSQDVSATLASVYKVLGTSDSSIVDSAGQDTHSIKFIDTLLPVQAYASAGTSSVTAVDITRLAEPRVTQTLDVRALDCGGSRELSDVYLLFQ